MLLLHRRVAQGRAHAAGHDRCCAIWPTRQAGPPMLHCPAWYKSHRVLAQHRGRQPCSPAYAPYLLLALLALPLAVAVYLAARLALVDMLDLGSMTSDVTSDEGKAFGRRAGEPGHRRRATPQVCCRRAADHEDAAMLRLQLCCPLRHTAASLVHRTHAPPPPTHPHPPPTHPHARTHSRTHAHTHTHTHALLSINSMLWGCGKPSRSTQVPVAALRPLLLPPPPPGS